MVFIFDGNAFQENVNEQLLISSIMTSVMEPPFSVYEQCETQEEKTECNTHLPAAKFDIVISHPGGIEGKLLFL